MASIQVHFILNTSLIHRHFNAIYFCSFVLYLVYLLYIFVTDMKNLIFVFLVCCSFPVVPSYAFLNKDLHILTMKDGLADNMVSHIYKDKDGFMWFATNNGVSRYDGKLIKNFSSGLSSMYISQIAEVSNYCMGFIINNELRIFNRRTETFIPLKLQHGSQELKVSRILPVGDGKFWGIHRNQISLYQVHENKDENGCTISLTLNIEKHNSIAIDKDAYLSEICLSENHRDIYLVTDNGQLIELDGKNLKVRKLIHIYKKQNLTINSMLNSGGFIWIATIAEGIIRYHISTGLIDRITYGKQGKENMLSHTDVFQVIPIDKNRYLAVTWNGYTLLTLDKKQPENLTTEVYNNTYINNRNLETRMVSAYYDPEGLLWIGTNGGGVLYSDLRVQYYNQYHQDRHNEICGITVDNNRYLWLATYHKGIMRSEQPFSTAHALNFKQIDVSGIGVSKTVLCLLKDKQGNIWFGHKDGNLTFYNEKTGIVETRTLVVNRGVRPTEIWALYIDSNSRFWIGTNQGIFLYHPETNLCEQLNIHDQSGKKSALAVRAIAETKDGTIWIGSSNLGISRLKIQNKENIVSIVTGYEKRKHIEGRHVRSLLASSDGNLYIGYSDGFAILSPQMDMIREFYTTNNGMCSNYVGCIVEDQKGHVWLGNNSGMSRYSRHQHLFYNYYIAGSNRSAFLYDHILLWGNNKSLTYFNPDDVDSYQIDNKVLITNLKVADRPVGIGEKINGQIILNRNISFADSIVLSNANRDFSLTFNNLSYSEEQQKYNYRLLPYQNYWLVSNGGEKAAYTNLPEGEYVFEVRNIYPDGHLGDITRLKIEILPHWSHTILFRLIVILLFVVIVLYLVRLFNKRRRRLEHEMQMKQEFMALALEREKEHQLRTERENFFTGAAHELRTPLTLILSPLQELLYQTQPTDPLYNRLMTMYKNGTFLHSLVDQLLYVQKIEAGMVKLQLSETDIVGLVKNIIETFEPMAETKAFHFEKELPKAPINLWIDAEKISSSIRNLVSNAFKYTSSGGTISVNVTNIEDDAGQFCVITVSDTGVGIPEDLQEHIFDSFITGDNIPTFSTKVGIGLRIVKNTMDLHHGRIILNSVQGKGSRFELYIPMGKAHFVNDSYSTVSNSEDQEKEFEVSLPDQIIPNELRKVPLTQTKLLIIEDNDAIREYVCSLFASKYILYEAGDGEEGIRIATEQLPDLIISDVMMPIKDGFMCCREIRMNPKTSHIPILMLTAKAEDADVLRSTRCGVDDYMMKPFNPELLKAKVDNLILQRERLKRIYTKALMLKQESVTGDKEDVFMQQVISVIEANLSNENFNVKLLAEQLNMSQPTLYRKMKQHTDLTVIDIIRSVRVSKAASFIMENRFSIQEVSEMVGFSDIRTLRKHFTEQFGVSPSKYMENRMEGE